MVVVAGSNKQTVDDFKELCLKGSPRSKVEDVKVLSWKHPVELGFEIRKTK